MQTNREVMDALLRGRPADRVGLDDRIWGDTLGQWLEQGYPKTPDGKAVSPTEHFGFDTVDFGPVSDYFPLRGHTEVLEETDDWVVNRNGAGAALKHWKHRSGVPEHVDFRMTSRAVWDADYRPHLIELDEQRLNVAGAREFLAKHRQAGRFCVYGQLFLWEIMRCSLGDVCMLESLLLDGDWIHDFNRVYTDFYIRHMGRVFEQAGVPDGVLIYEDLGYRNGLFCSPKTYADLLFPYYGEYVRFLHSYDIPVLLHTCGRVTDAMDLIVEAGFDYVDPMERKAGCDPFAFAEKYGDRLALRGGLDVRVLERGDRDEIRREVTNLVEGMKARTARYIFSSDHSISTGVTYADFQYALEVYREHRMY